MKIGFLFALLFLSTNLLASGTGYSSYPLVLEKSLLSTELTGITSTGGGMGVQGRYTQKLNPSMVFDGGIGVSGGERNGRIFANMDYEIFPDYREQPRVGIKTGLENVEEFDSRINRLGIAPVVSKGFSFWGEEAYPFFSLPTKLNLNSDTDTYYTSFSANFGITGNIPVQGYRHLIGSLETQIDINDSYTALFMGITYPLN